MSEADDRARKVKTRRTKRKLKAAASVAIALTAGLFLACQRGVTEVQKAIDAARGDDTDAHASDAGTSDPAITVKDASADATDAGQALDAGRPDAALAKRSSNTKDAAVDVNEHRKGMPVRDNLLE